MKQYLMISCSLFAMAATGSVHAGSCNDAWVTKAIQEVTGKPPIGSGNSGDCNVKNYGLGKWSNYADLVGKVRAVQPHAAVHAPALANPATHLGPGVALRPPVVSQDAIKAGQASALANQDSLKASKPPSSLIGDGGSGLVRPSSMIGQGGSTLVRPSSLVGNDGGSLVPPSHLIGNDAAGARSRGN